MRYTALVLAAVLCSIALVAFGQVPSATAAAPGRAVVLLTIVEGDVAVIRESRKFTGVEGMALREGDIVQAGDAAPFARIEWAGGGTADLGPASELLLAPRYAEPGAERAAQAYLMRGWLKLAGQRVDVASARGDLVDVQGAAVLHAGDGTLQVYMESGRARLVERFDGRAAQTHALTEGETFLRRGSGTGVVTRRPVPQLLQAVPRPFTDTLPLRAARWQGRSPAPGAGADVAYGDVSAWINAERALRPGFVQRWRGRAGDATFRKSLLAELAEHPEWHRVLYPEKYAAQAAAKRRAALPAHGAAGAQPARAAAGAEPAHAAAAPPTQSAAAASQSAPTEPRPPRIERGGVADIAGLPPAGQ